MPRGRDRDSPDPVCALGHGDRLYEFEGVVHVIDGGGGVLQHVLQVGDGCGGADDGGGGARGGGGGGGLGFGGLFLSAAGGAGGLPWRGFVGGPPARTGPG